VKIAFDGVCFGDGPITGVARAFQNGLSAYVAMFGGEHRLLLPHDAPSPEIAGLRVVPAPRGRWRRQFALPKLLRAHGVDALHSSVASVPVAARCPTLATVHDLPWLHPEIGERTSMWRAFATLRSLRAAAAVIAPSTRTLNDAARLVRGTHRLHLVPHGTPRLDGEPDGTAPRPGPFLVLGDDRPRKNRAQTAAGHAIAARQHPNLPPLHFVGPPDAWVDEATKRELLRTCCAVVQCSTFEGFGMPVLEALAHGAPVVCSDIEPFREIAANCAIYVDPHSAESIADGLLRVLEPDRRAALVPAGWRRAERFSPEATAGQWRALHEQVIGR
jgi:glycosyltransferase involved in cell wall biosynthesis